MNFSIYCATIHKIEGQNAWGERKRTDSMPNETRVKLEECHGAYNGMSDPKKTISGGL